MQNSVIIRFWNDELKIGFNNLKEAISIENNQIVRYKAEVNNGTLRFRHMKKVIRYNKLNSIMKLLDEYMEKQKIIAEQIDN